MKDDVVYTVKEEMAESVRHVPRLMNMAKNRVSVPVSVFTLTTVQPGT